MLNGMPVAPVAGAQLDAWKKDNPDVIAAVLATWPEDPVGTAWLQFPTGKTSGS
jgi:hypothetical protein